MWKSGENKGIPGYSPMDVFKVYTENYRLGVREGNIIRFQWSADETVSYGYL